MGTSEYLMKKSFYKTSFSKIQLWKWYGMGPCMNSTVVNSEKLALGESEIVAETFCSSM